MVIPLGLIGILAGWTLVLIAGATLGYGLVVAWQHWGRTLPVPEPVKPVAVQILGPAQVPDAKAPKSVATPPSAPTDTPTDPASLEWGDEDLPQEEGEQEEVAVVPPTQDEDDDTAPAPDPNAPATPEPDRTPPTYRLTRADAIEELSILFDAPYEQAKTLVDHGLWGMENHEEWARANRGRPAPETLDETLYQQILSANPQTYGPRLNALREKQASLRQLQTLWGVGPEEAEALHQAGFTDLEAIRLATTDKLAKVPGIGHALAFQMRAAAHGLAPTA